MHHVAIMKKSWKLLDKISFGEKKAESRWLKKKSNPWNRVRVGDTIWFKNSSEYVTLKANATKVLQFSNLTPEKTQRILNKYQKKDLGLTNKIPTEILDYFKNKNYCIIVFFNQVKKVRPFKINKRGFGAMTAWITIRNINAIKDNNRP
jgi:hypothetical protein